MQANPSSQSNASGTGIGSLATLLKRLEAATSRLEDIAISQSAASTIAGHSPPAAPPAPAAANSSSATASPVPGAQAQAQSPPLSIKAFDELLEGPLAKYVELSQAVGGVVAEQANHVASTFRAQRGFLVLASSVTKIPTSAPLFMEVLQPTQAALISVTEAKEKNRSSKLFNHLSEVAEGIPALGWVTLDSKPGPFVAEMKDAAMFYTNRVIKESKDKEEAEGKKHADWARSFVALLEELRKFIMAHHTTALTWNAKGQDPATYLASNPLSSSTPSSKGGASPPPPPAPPAGTAPPPPPPSGPATSSSAPSKPKAGGDLSAVFGELNKGESVTSGLRKVDKSEMTHKNPSLRSTSTVPTSSSSSSDRPNVPKKPGQLQKKPAKKELDGTKWYVENYENDSSIVIDSTEISHTVNLFNCKSSIVSIKGKVNAISMINCTKTSLLIESTVSALSITSSPSFTVQILGVVPTILVDSTDGGQIYLSKEGLGVEVITAKTSGLNISIPEEGGEEGMFVEKPVPEQMLTKVEGGKLKTTIVEHAG